jgi:hypothetical protein
MFESWDSGCLRVWQLACWSIFFTCVRSSPWPSAGIQRQPTLLNWTGSGSTAARQHGSTDCQAECNQTVGTEDSSPPSAADESPRAGSRDDTNRSVGSVLSSLVKLQVLFSDDGDWQPDAPHPPSKNKGLVCSPSHKITTTGSQSLKWS